MGTLKEHNETNKNNKIKEIRNLGFEIEHFILRHGLTEKEAFEIESSIIDFIGIENLTNEVSGHNSEQRGLMTLTDIKINYEAEEINPEEPLLLININHLYNKNKNMSYDEIYEATRKSWKVSLDRVKRIKIACSVYRGIIREVFIMEKWEETSEKGRRQFFGVKAPEEIREKYLNKSVNKYWKQGSQNPIKYIL